VSCVWCGADGIRRVHAEVREPVGVEGVLHGVRPPQSRSGECGRSVLWCWFGLEIWIWPLEGAAEPRRSSIHQYYAFTADYHQRSERWIKSVLSPAHRKSRTKGRFAVSRSGPIGR
jgi:hypothetical protein